MRTVPGWCYALGLVLLFVAGSALGAEPKYTPLVGLPGVTNQEPKSLGEYMNALYLLTISVGGLIAVVQISIAGVEYSMSDIVTNKADAKKRIQGVLLGLAILLVPALVLKTINPDLLSLDVLKLEPKVELKPSRATTGGNIGGGTADNEQIKNCASQPNSKWDSVCNKCILKTETAGASCGKPPPSVAGVTTACSNFTFTPPATPATLASTCKTFCEQTLKGTFSSANMTCTYGGGG